VKSPQRKKERGPRKSTPRRSFGVWKMGLALVVASLAVGWFAWQQRQSPSRYTQRPRGTVTFNKDIAPIVFGHCAGCHRPGEAAPFPLLKYGDVKKHAAQIAEVTRSGFMPPWLPEDGHVELQGRRRLSVEQRGLIEQWVAESAPEGRAADLPAQPQWPEGWQFGTPDLVVTMPEAYFLPAEGKDVYRNFVIPVPTPSLRYVRAIELRPSSKAVHHAFIRFDRTDECRQQDAQEPGPGFAGMTVPSSAYSPAGHFLGWQPGRGPVQAPEGLSWELPAGVDMVLLMHLQPRGKSEPIQASVGFFFTDTPPTNTPAKVSLKVYDIDIPAGAARYEVEKRLKVPLDVDLLATLPHAHYLGRRLEAFARLPDGTRQTLLLIPEWDFNWQSDFRFARPVFLPKGSEIGLHFTYDNSTNNTRNPYQPPARVPYGLQTTNEMGELHFQLLAHRAADRQQLLQQEQQWARADLVEFYERHLRQNPADAEAMLELAKVRLLQGEMPVTEALVRQAVALRPDLSDGHYSLGIVLMSRTNVVEAEQAFLTTIGMAPTHYKAHNNAGLCALRLGRLDTAAARFREALRLHPGDSVAQANLDLVLKMQR
jgi:mono/diheme cytochrome c family protein